MAEEFMEPAFAGAGAGGGDAGGAIRFNTGVFAGFREPDWAAVYSESAGLLRADRDLRVCANCPGDICRTEHNAIRETRWTEDRQGYQEVLLGYAGSGRFQGRAELRGWFGVRAVGPDGWPEWAIRTCGDWMRRRQKAIQALSLGDEVALGPGDPRPRVLRQTNPGGALEGSVEVELDSTPWDREEASVS